MTEKEIELRARRAHERMHGQSTFIEVHYMRLLNKCRVNDHELGIITYWRVNPRSKRVVMFDEQMGERA